MGSTKIAWTNATWNPVVGCSHVSDGCRNCYAERLALRFGWSKKPWTSENARENVVLHPERLGQPLCWRRLRRIFVCSMGDLFHEQVPDDFIAAVFSVMARARHVFQVLTKRPQRMLAWLADSPVGERPLPNLWLGVSVEDQRTASERVPLLMRVPAAVRFVSCEPLLGPIDLAQASPCGYYCGEAVGHVDHPFYVYQGCATGGGIHWVIVGGESGPNFRRMDLDWARSIRDQCVAAGVPFFFKQGSGVRPGMNPLLDGVEWRQFPLSLANETRQKGD